MVRIQSVTPHSPADICGVKEGDILEKINGHDVKDVLDYMYYEDKDDSSSGGMGGYHSGSSGYGGGYRSGYSSRRRRGKGLWNRNIY